MIQAMHEITDEAKVEAIAESIARDGWTGYPLLVVTNGSDGYIALTGTHRIAAAERVGIEPDIEIIEQPTIDELSDEQTRLWEELLVWATDDDDRLRALRDLAAAGDVDDYAVEIMAAEIANND